jgi:hypothetical protein
LEAIQGSARNYRAQTDRQTDWRTDWQADKTRQTDAFGRKAHYTGRSQGKYSLFCCFGFWGWGRKTVVNGTSFCVATRDDGYVESLCCISCFCSFGFWGWGRKTALNGSLLAVSSGDRCGESLDLRGWSIVLQFLVNSCSS